MTEADWLTTSTRPKAMLRQVLRSGSPRQFRLVGCASCRLIRRYLSPIALDVIRTTELHADGLADDLDLRRVREVYLQHRADLDSPFDLICFSPATGREAVDSLLNDAVRKGAVRAVDWVIELAGSINLEGPKTAARADIRRQVCDVIREVFGNPFHPFRPVAGWLGGGFVQPDGLTVRLTDAVHGLAAGIHADQAFDRLPLLADALEDAGATDPDLLGHCRTGTGHVRGCWALDAVLGRS